MPQAQGRDVHRCYGWEPLAILDQTPVVQNTWYTVLEAEDVRVPYITIMHDNTDNVAKEVEIRLTLDGSVYTITWTLADNTWNWIHCLAQSDAFGNSATPRPAGANDDDHGLEIFAHDFKYEIRMTAVPGTNEVLSGRVRHYTHTET